MGLGLVLRVRVRVRATISSAVPWSKHRSMAGSAERSGAAAGGVAPAPRAAERGTEGGGA